MAVEIVWKKFGGLFMLVTATAVLAIASLSVICAKSAEAAEVGVAEILSLEDCLAIAEAYHPSLAGAEASVAAERGRLVQSVIGDRLTISGSAATSRTGSRASENASFSVGASAAVKIFDSNKSKYSVEAARNTLSATEETANQTLLDVRSSVKSAYSALLLSYKVTEQSAESVAAFERHLEQAQGFYDAGSKPWYDVTKAQVDLGNARLALVEAQANEVTRRAELLYAMGVSIRENFDIEATEWSIPDTAELDAEARAVATRPDLKASRLKIEAARATIGAEARASSPTVSLSGGYSADGDQIGDLGKGWNIGLKMTVPIVDGGETKARVDTATAQLASQQASYDKMEQDVLLEVRRVASDLKKARERIRLSEITLQNAEENRKLAEGRYEMGVGNALEVTDALVSLTEAYLTKYQAYYDLQTAMIDLEKAVGEELTFQ